MADASQSKATRFLSIYVHSPLCSSAPVRISGGAAASYPDFAGAYAQAADGGTVQLQALDFGEDFQLDREVGTTLRGGYDCGFSASAAATTVLGNLRVTGGVVRIDALRFR